MEHPERVDAEERALQREHGEFKALDAQDSQGNKAHIQYGTLTLGSGPPDAAAYNHIKSKREDDVNYVKKNKPDELGNINELEDLTKLLYTVEVHGPEPADGYALYLGMHGGGGIGSDQPTLKQARPNNHVQWSFMSRAYKDALPSYVWISLRGIGDTWDLHFTAASYILVERLIENHILFGARRDKTASRIPPTASVNPNRVYLIGFSAGGDGVYRLAGRLAQRFAAGNMGGGHPGSMIQGFATPPDNDFDDKRLDSGLRNLANTPICLQVGELDDVYDRCRQVAQSGVDLDHVQKHYREDVFHNPTANIFDHAVYIHTADKTHFGWEAHNFWWTPGGESNRPANLNPPVIADYRAWKNSWTADGKPPVPTPATTTAFATNSVLNWFAADRHTRNPAPPYVVWDLAEPRGNDNFDPPVAACMGAAAWRQNYWLDVVGAGTGPGALDVGTLIEAGMDGQSNTISVYAAKNYLRLLLRPGMVVSLGGDISVVVYDRARPATSQRLGPIRLGWSERVIDDTLARNDWTLVFCSDIVLTQEAGGKWKWATNSPPRRVLRL